MAVNGALPTTNLDGAFDDDGWVVRPVLGPDEVAGLRAAVAAYLDRVVDALLVPVDETHPSAGFDERLERISAGDDPFLAALLATAAGTDAQRDPMVAGLVDHEAVHAVVGELTGREVEGGTVRVRCNVPSLPNRREPWHTDVVVDDGLPCSRVRTTCWIPLVDVGPGVGGLEVVTGRRSEAPTHEPMGPGLGIPEDDLGLGERVAVECVAGDGVFLDRFTPHRTLAPADGRVRWSVVLWLRHVE